MDALKSVTNRIKAEFVQHDTRILRSNKTNSLLTRLQYTREFINSYNQYISEINKYFDHIGYPDQTTIRTDFILFKGKVHKYTGAYNIPTLPVPEDGYHTIEIADDDLKTRLF